MFCIVTPDRQTTGIFGFAVFVQAFALLILVYTASDVRSRFRVATAPIRLWVLIFWSSAFIGLGTLITDFWFAQQLPLPAFLANQVYWQLFFGALFLSLILTWIWYAFVRPPVFGRWTARNYARALYSRLLQGAESDLPIIASELAASAQAIIRYSRQLAYRPIDEHNPPEPNRVKHTVAADYAHDILLLIANRKFCRHIVESAPATAMAFFGAMTQHAKYRVPIGQFAANISTEALMNKDSILYHEDEGYYSGYFGYVRPFTNTVYGDFHLVEALTEGSSPLDVDMGLRFSFDAEQLKAYCRAVLTTFESALEKRQFSGHSYALRRAFEIIEHSCMDLYKLNEEPPVQSTSDITARVNACISLHQSRHRDP
jgi:hypothetical protein